MCSLIAFVNQSSSIFLLQFDLSVVLVLLFCAPFSEGTALREEEKDGKKFEFGN